MPGDEKSLAETTALIEGELRQYKAPPGSWVISTSRLRSLPFISFDFFSRASILVTPRRDTLASCEPPVQCCGEVSEALKVRIFRVLLSNLAFRLVRMSSRSADGLYDARGLGWCSTADRIKGKGSSSTSVPHPLLRRRVIVRSRSFTPRRA